MQNSPFFLDHPIEIRVPRLLIVSVQKIMQVLSYLRICGLQIDRFIGHLQTFILLFVHSPTVSELVIFAHYNKVVFAVIHL